MIRPHHGGIEGKAGAWLKGYIIPVRDISAEDERAWRDLAQRAVEPNPFYEPDCVIPAGLHQEFGADIHIAVAVEDGRFYCCIPIRETTHWKFPYPVVTSQVRRMGYLGTPLVDADRGVEAVSTVLGSLARRRRALHGRIFLLDTSGGDGPVARIFRQAAMRNHFPLRAYERWDRGKLVRLDEPAYERVHSSKARYNLRRQRRLLAEELGNPVVLVDRTDDLAALDDYVEMEASGYKSEEGVAMAGVPGEPEYFVDMCRRFRQAGRLHVLALMAGSKTIAMEIWIRGGEGLFMIKISYDEKYKRFGPGVLLQTEAMRYFHNCTDASWIDTCTSEGADLLLRLYPARRRVEMLSVCLSSSLVDRAVVAGFVGLRPVHRRFYDARHAKARA